MEGELHRVVYQVVRALAKQFPRRQKQFSDAQIVLTFLWSVLYDRPRCWACQRANWPASMCEEPLPSPATLSRRLRTESVQHYLRAVEAVLRAREPSSWCKWLDGLPLIVGGASGDREARVGWAVAARAKGYKLHAICDARGGLDAWRVTPLNLSEKNVAPQLLDQLTGEGYVVADGYYDANRLYEAAGAAGFQLLARKRHGALGHRRHSAYRLRSVALQQQPFGRYLLAQRFGIDRWFGTWGNFGGGLSPLPHWVRHLERVRLWVQGKIIINAARLWLKQRLTA